MTNIFPQDHVFTRLLAEEEAAEAARLAEAEQRAQEDERQRRAAMVLKMAEFANHIGQEFMEAITPYIAQADYHRQSGMLTLRLDIPQHDRIHVYYSRKGATVKTYGIGENYFRPDYMQPFAEALMRARAQYEREAAALARQEAIAAAQAEYEAERARIREANRAALEALQTEYDGDFELYTLEYGIITNDGEQELGTEVVKVMYDDSDESDRWLTVDYHGVMRRQKFFYPVSLRGPDQYRASKTHYARPVRVDGHGVVGYVPPTDSDERVAAYAQRAAAVLQPLPAVPEILTGLDI